MVDHQISPDSNRERACAAPQPKARRKAAGGALHTHGASQGYVVLPRSLFSHPILGDDPYDRRSALTWLVVSARWAPGELRTMRGLVRIERGQIAATYGYLAEAWGWDRMKVRRFLKAITRANLIRTQTDQAVRVITVCDYEQFARFSTVADHKVFTNRPQADQNQKDKTPGFQKYQKAAPSGHAQALF